MDAAWACFVMKVGVKDMGGDILDDVVAAQPSRALSHT